jgi:hypothetical protein
MIQRSGLFSRARLLGGQAGLCLECVSFLVDVVYVMPLEQIVL